MIREIKALVRRIVDLAVSRIRTHIPVQVVSYDAAENTVSVQPVVKVIRTEDPASTGPALLPILEDVPVRQLGSGKLLFSVAPVEGSYGVLHISDREIHAWLSAGGTVAPASARKFDMSDAVFEPGLYPYVVDGDNGKIDGGIQTDRISMRTRSGLTEISVLDDESVFINMNDGEAVLTLAADGTIDITAAKDVTITSDGKVKTDAAETVLQAGSDWAVQFTALKSAFDTLKQDLNTFITVKYNLHMHPTAAVGAPSAPTVTGTATTADMAGAKVTKVRVP